MIRLGLIGDNIERSKSPSLHRLAGRLCGLDVSYDLLVPSELGITFDEIFARCQGEGFRGLNITYPYKELAFSRLAVVDPKVAAVGSCNTALFEDGSAVGWNTDYTGFVKAFRSAFPRAQPGVVAMAGAGGVGRAIALALAELGADALRLVDADVQRAETLASSLRANGLTMHVIVCASVADAVVGCDGLVNATPLGMDGIAGTAISSTLMAGRRWAFDAVYTPVETQFLSEARLAGLETLSGYELFFHQGIDAFHRFTGHEVDAPALRNLLARSVGEAA